MMELCRRRMRVAVHVLKHPRKGVKCYKTTNPHIAKLPNMALATFMKSPRIEGDIHRVEITYFK